jgi:hypothetical protein
MGNTNYHHQLRRMKVWCQNNIMDGEDGDVVTDNRLVARDGV